MNLDFIGAARREIAFVFGGVGAAALVWIPFLLRKSLKIRSWPAATGVITKSAVRQDEVDPAAWFPDVCFSFPVDGRECAGKRIALIEMGFTSRQKAEARIAHYPVGQEVTVFYNPRKPGDAVLERKINSWFYVSLGMTAAAFLAIGICAWAGVRLPGFHS